MIVLDEIESVMNNFDEGAMHHKKLRFGISYTNQKVQSGIGGWRYKPNTTKIRIIVW